MLIQMWEMSLLNPNKTVKKRESILHLTLHIIIAKVNSTGNLANNDLVLNFHTPIYDDDSSSSTSEFMDATPNNVIKNTNEQNPLNRANTHI